MKKAPKIRFDGYTEDWEQRRLSELLSFSNGFNGSKDMYGEGIPYISVMDILNNDVITYDIIQGKVNLDERVAQRYIVEYGDILFQRSSENIEDAGRSNVYVDTERTAVFGGFVIRGKKVSEYDPIFMKKNLETRQVRNQITSCAQGAQHINVGQETLGSVKVYFPLLNEQKIIGNFFQTLDNFITFHQKECEKMLDFKEYMLSKMFPMGEEDYPDVRVQGYSSSWTRRKFADFSFPTGEKNKNNLPLEPYAITKEYGFIAQSEAHEEFGYMKDADRTLYIIVRPNSFAYNPARINIGSLGYYEGTENVIVSSLYEVFQTDDDIDDTFLQYWFKTNEFKRWIERLQEGSVRLYFYYDKLCECTLMMPCLQEQQAIGQYFRKLDELILLHQHEVEAYKKMKQYMLRNMFV